MKKYIFLFLVLCVAAGFAAADDEGIGLSVGLEFGIGIVDEDVSPYLMPMIIYENSFLDETLDLYAELDYTLGFTKEPNEDGDEVNPQSMYIDLMVGYNLGLGDASTLSFILENEFDEIVFSPVSMLRGIFTPAVKFNHELDFGSLYAQIGLPITYYDIEDLDSTTGLDFTLGWSSTFGLGIEAKICTLLSPGDDAGYSGFEATISYEAESIYAEVEIIIPKEIDFEGITITPEFDYSFKNFTFYIKCEFAGIGVDGSSISVTPALGIKYSF
ncbi:MAG: hypothetical protein LBC52_06035 [Treponema sp.]|jgi:hypothetical protein|nr:hypothetical protein [Treponema sp.]